MMGIDSYPVILKRAAQWLRLFDKTEDAIDLQIVSELLEEAEVERLDDLRERLGLGEDL